MNSEVKILKKIWENDESATIRRVSSQTGLGLNYTRYICDYLFKKGEIEPVKNYRDCYKITLHGKKNLKLAGIIKPKLGERISDIEKVVYYLPRLGRAEEKKFNLGKSIEKAVSFLKNL